MMKLTMTGTAKLLSLAVYLTWCVVAEGAEESRSSSSSTSSHGSDTSHRDDSGDGSSHSDSSHASSHSDSSHSDGPNVFVLGEYFDYDTFLILLSIVGGSAMILELALAKYDEYLRSEGDTFQSTLKDKIMRELMTLGVVSFLLFLLEPVVTHGTLFLIFEFTHYVIFFIAIFTVLQLVMLGASTYPIQAAWDRAAYKSKEEILAGYNDAIASRGWSARLPLLGHMSFDVMHWGAEWVWIDCVEYHVARSVFIRQFERPADFDFARYACLVTDRMILNMANPPMRSWIMLVVLHWIGYGIQEAFALGSHLRHEAWFVFGLVLLGLEIALLYACTLGVRRILVKLGADSSDTRGTMDRVLERVWVAPVTHMQQSRVRRNISMQEGLSALASVDGEVVTTGTEEKNEVSDTDHGKVNGNRTSGHNGRTGCNGKSTSAEAPLSITDPNKINTTIPPAVETEVVVADEIPEITRRDAFLVSSSRYHRWTIEALMMLNSYYLAFFAVYHIGSISKSDEWYWIILLPLPILCGTLMAYRRVLPLFSLLSAVVVVHNKHVAHVIADVEQEAEEINKLRRKLVLRVQDVIQKEFHACALSGEKSHDQTSACFLISRWDLDGDHKLSYQELEIGLAEFGLVLSRRQRRELLRLADPDRSGSIDIDELTDFLYDVEVAVAEAEAAAAAAEGKIAQPESSAERNGDAVGVNDLTSLDRLLRSRSSSRWPGSRTSSSRRL